MKPTVWWLGLATFRLYKEDPWSTWLIDSRLLDNPDDELKEDNPTSLFFLLTWLEYVNIWFDEYNRFR